MAGDEVIVKCMQVIREKCIFGNNIELLNNLEETDVTLGIAGFGNAFDFYTEEENISEILD